jgi:hypothetical protein
MTELTVRLIFGALCIYFGMVLIFKRQKHAERRVEPAISEPEDVINPLSWAIAWLFSFIPTRVWAALIIALGVYSLVGILYP